MALPKLPEGLRWNVERIVDGDYRVYPGEPFGSVALEKYVPAKKAPTRWRFFRESVEDGGWKNAGTINLYDEEIVHTSDGETMRKLIRKGYKRGVSVFPSLVPYHRVHPFTEKTVEDAAEKIWQQYLTKLEEKRQKEEKRLREEKLVGIYPPDEWKGSK